MCVRLASLNMVQAAIASKHSLNTGQTMTTPNAGNSLSGGKITADVPNQ